MRSHMLNLYVPPKAEPLVDETELDLVSSSSEEEQELDEDDKGLFGYGLRENPKKSVRLVDPEFSAFNVTHDHQAGSVVLQDRESETESSRNPVRRRSKRVRKSGNFEQLVDGEYLKRPEPKKPKLVKLSSHTELASWVDPEPVSSISDTTPEEDVAYCLMMLSRDKWRREKELVVEHDDEDREQEQEQEEAYYEQSENESDHEVKVSKASRARSKYRCDTCNKVFKSYQALGGHRASHKKIRLNSDNHNHHRNAPIQNEDIENAGVVEEKIHECPVCFRVFASGQALGGHKRSHVIGSSATIAATGIAHTGVVHAKPVAKKGEMSLIDLNLPAPMEDEDEISQIELSAVSDGEFVKTH